MEGLSPVSIVGAPYNSLQIGTVVAFSITYFFATFFLVLRYIQAVKIVKKFELDLAILTLAWGLGMYYMITLVQCGCFFYFYSLLLDREPLSSQQITNAVNRRSDESRMGQTHVGTFPGRPHGV